ncbi:transglutaminase-like domain-containing protein [Aquibacillus koreensis]|uniref:Transglutaminase-like domain-containing protein n=1 Tax=Aquibacillus koreensis TaxID=279446 RepID=A0A9X3WPF9_9BACI|nr:transglutaminase-like domain-containing protein [Aquibacillus koreensis]MCT2535175.1 transglutaminase-like domain-containing protein [Aquibacillus koreensis]MDC3421034.1 transglutaminase-like domain-containing protein [Aquibacillus koreensis]
MKLILETDVMEEYLRVLEVVDYTHPSILKKVDELFTREDSEIEKVKKAFEFVRDEISHSWDIQGTRVTCKASDVLFYKEGICYAKSNLLAALLRAEGIPTGFCYQRLMIFDTPDQGYSLHTLNGVYLQSMGCWIRLDARGNKPGVEAEFAIDDEKLAFDVREVFDEIDYPTIFAKPNTKTIATLQKHINAIEMYKHHLPEYI